MTELKSIWHSQLEIPMFDDTVVFIDDLGNWHTGYTQRDNDGITDHDSGEIYTEENLLRWAYVKDLLACEKELADTKKKLDIAVETIRDVKNDPDTSQETTDYLAYRLEQINQKEEELKALEMLVNNVFK